MVADAVERLGAQVERREHDVGAPHGVVVPALDVRRQGVLAGVAARTVAAVVAEGDGLGEGDVEAQTAGDRGGDLGDLEGVGEPRALVVVGEDEHLGLAGEPSEGAGVQDAVAVALEAGAVGVGWLLQGTVARPLRPGGQGREQGGFTVLPVGSLDDCPPAGCGLRVGMGEPQRRAPPVAVHGGCPALGPIGHPRQGSEHRHAPCAAGWPPRPPRPRPPPARTSTRPTSGRQRSTRPVLAAYARSWPATTAGSTSGRHSTSITPWSSAWRTTCSRTSA